MSGESDNVQPERAGQEELRRQGFALSEDGTWEGKLITEQGAIAARVSLPARFPHCLPEVSVTRQALPRRIPHVEASGKLCLPDGQGTLIDASRPADVVKEALTLATQTLQSGLSGRSDPDFCREFAAYWEHNHGGRIYSICSAAGPSRQVCMLSARAPWDSSERLLLLADTDEEGCEWLKCAGAAPLEREPAWFFRLSAAFIPPDFDTRFTTKQFLNAVRSYSDPIDYERFRGFTRDHHLPIVAAFGMPATMEGEIVAAVRFEKPYGANRKEAAKGFRPGRVPAWKEFGCTSRQPVTRLELVRLDNGFLLPRGGADRFLSQKKVLVVGIGAIGSRLAEKLAMMGVGFLRLVDKDAMGVENLHRHMLGVESLNTNKAQAVRCFLERRFPNLRVEAKEQPFDAPSDIADRLLDSIDLLCVAVGDETLELQWDDALRKKYPRLHVWVEPIGVGAHCLLTGLEPTGCLRCLYERDDRSGLHNRSAFAAPRQQFAKSFSGCAGTFTPFSGLDADRAASEAAELAVRTLTGHQSCNVLVSRFGNPEDFLKAGFRLSDRAALFHPDEVRKEYAFADPNCLCSRWGEK